LCIISQSLAKRIYLTILDHTQVSKKDIYSQCVMQLYNNSYATDAFISYYLSIMEIGDLVYHKLLWQGILIDLNLSSAVVKFKSGYKQLPQSLLQTSFQEVVKKKEVSKDYDEQYFDMHREDNLILNSEL